MQIRNFRIKSPHLYNLSYVLYITVNQFDFYQLIIAKDSITRDMEKQFHRNQRNCLIVLEEFGKWYESQIDEVREENSPPIDDELLQQIQKRADELLKQETESHIQSCRNGNRGEADWLDTVARKGTFADRLSALQLRIKKSPVHSLNYLEQFVEIVLRKGAKVRQAYSITKMLKEIFLAELLPPNRKLLTFNQRPLEKWWKLNEADARKRLIMWKFEAGLKLCYQRFLNGLQSLASNMVEGVAQTACSEMAELLTERPEQEQFLLAALVNRLGHPQHRVGAKVAQMLELLVQKHPNMRLVVVKEIEQIIFRKNISPKTQRYALHFLSRMFFDAGEFELALHLIQIYLRFFRILVLKDAINEHRLLPLLVSGLNRAFPYAKGKKLNSDLVKDVESLYAIVQTAKFSTALSVLRLLFQIHNFNEGLSDRFYSAFYRRLLNLPSNPNSQLDGQLFDLVEKVLKNDLVESRVRAFLKRLFQVALANNAAFAAAALLACSRVVLQRPNLLRLDASLNSRIIGADEKPVPGKAGKSRAVSSKNTVKLELEEQGTSKSKPTTHWYSEGGANDGEEDEEEEEKYVDVKLESGEEGEEVHVNGIKPVKQEQCGSAGWVHRQISDETNGLKGTKPGNHGLRNQRTKLFATRNAYDPTARNPLFSGADFTLDTELYTLARHYHPTVAAFAAALIKGEPIEYKGTPLADLSHIRFLDRFAFKNPKTRPDEGGKKPDLDDQTSQNSDDISLDEDSSIDEEEEETLLKQFSEDDSGDAVLSSSDDGSSYSEQEIEVVKAPTNKDPSKRKRFQRKESKKERQNVHRPAKKRLRITA